MDPLRLTVTAFGIYLNLDLVEVSLYGLSDPLAFLIRENTGPGRIMVLHQQEQRYSTFICQLWCYSFRMICK